MDNHVTIQVGDKNYVIDTAHLPPVGTRIPVHKHLTSSGAALVLEVVAHEWRLEDRVEVDEVDGNPVLSVAIKTREVI